MNNSINYFFTSLSPRAKQFLLLGQFFLIIFAYHILKDLKDTIVITASDAGAEVIPFIKIWGMLPLAILVSYLFSKAYQRFGRAKSLYVFVSILLASYVVFAFIFFPQSGNLYLTQVDRYLRLLLPSGCSGLISMICYWNYTFFYLSAEVWSLLILSVLFWGHVNENTSFDQAKEFYPLCMITGNFAGIFSGQVSRYLCYSLRETVSWEQTVQCLIVIVVFCGFGVMAINYWLSSESPKLQPAELKKKKEKVSFQESIQAIFQSRQLLCISMLVVGFALAGNLFEVVWKESIRKVHPLPQDYNAFVNYLTFLISSIALGISFISHWTFKKISWSTIALITPITLFVLSLIFFSTIQLPPALMTTVTDFLDVPAANLVMVVGACYYVISMSAKYTIFDMTKEVSFLSIESEERMRAKSVIDSIGSRLGKSGASCLYQFLLIVFGTASGHIFIIGLTSICVIALTIFSTRQLGSYLSLKGNNAES